MKIASTISTLLVVATGLTALFALGSSALAQSATSTPSWTLTGMWAPPSSSSSTPQYVTSTLPPASILAATPEINAVKYTAQTNTIFLNWIDVYGAGGYKVVRTGGSGGALTGYSRSPDWTDSLPWGVGATSYTYTITALDVGGNEAATSTTFNYVAPSSTSL